MDINPNLLEVKVENQDVNKPEDNKDNVNANTNLTAIKAEEKEDNNEEMEIKDNFLERVDLVLYLLFIIFFVIKTFSNMNITEESKTVYAIKDTLTDKDSWKRPNINLKQVFSNKHAMDFLSNHLVNLIHANFQFNVTNNVKSLILGKIESHIKLPNYTKKVKNKQELPQVNS